MENITSTIFSAYDSYSQAGIRIDGTRTFDYLTYRNRLRALDGWTVVDSAITVQGMDIDALTIGTGDRKVLIWSQMHGNEPVSSLALLDLMFFLQSDHEVAATIRSVYTIVAVPLLNPEGHARNDRRNSLGIDINRDALDLASVEARFLDGLHKSLRPDVAFNLHDQEPTYSPGSSPYQTLVSLLAPECDFEGTVSRARRTAMKICGTIASWLSPYYPDRISRYQDTYTPTAFGDTFMGRGTASVLIEAGAYRNDPCRIVARRAMFAAIAMGLCSNEGSFGTLDEYDSLPVNRRDRVLYMRLRNITVDAGSGSVSLDLGIRRLKTSMNPEDFADDFDELRLMDIGNLGSLAAEFDFDASGCRLLMPGDGLYVTRKADFDILMDDGRVLNVVSILNNLKNGKY